MKQLTLLVFFVFLIFSNHSIFAKNAVQMIPESKPYDIKKKEPTKSPDKIKILGRIEHICIGDPGTKLKAKLDTGATTSSVNADIVKTIKRGRDRFVFYRIVDGDTKSDVIEAKITRYTLIKPKQEDKSKIRRPVVMTAFKIGQSVIRAEVNLAERDNFSYPLLIGRNVIKNNFAIDVSKKFTVKTSCQ